MYKQVLGTFLLVALTSGCVAFDATDNEDRSDGDPAPDRTRNTPPVTTLEPADVIRSQIFRDKGTQVYTYSQVANQAINTVHPIPRKTVDVEESINRPSNPVECGIGSTIGQRITDCRNKNNASAYTWVGRENANAGEGDWVLVAHKDNKSIWMDMTTNLLWSSPIGTATWDEASGNVAPAQQVCNAQDLAPEDQRFLGIAASEVSWRLPTRNDYLQADINGARYVLSTAPLGDSSIYWTANYIPQTSEAWAIRHSTGELFKRSETSTLPVRCVGVAQ
ncbi:MAG: hypothetical protein CME64_01900 [Halobacteriovoraceae bacterium]|nr:hypothetical protein [Halobacteriovoraceae bacterium]